MKTLPEIGYLRAADIIGRPANPKTGEPATPAIIPVSPATWWKGVKSGRFPKGIKMSAGVTVWHVDTIRELVAQMGRVAA